MKFIFLDDYITGHFLGHHRVLFIDRDLYDVCTKNISLIAAIYHSTHVVYVSTNPNSSNYCSIMAYKTVGHMTDLQEIFAPYFPSACVFHKTLALTKYDYAMLLYVIKDRIVNNAVLSKIEKHKNDVKRLYTQ